MVILLLFNTQLIQYSSPYSINPIHVMNLRPLRDIHLNEIFLIPWTTKVTAFFEEIDYSQILPF